LAHCDGFYVVLDDEAGSCVVGSMGLSMGNVFWAGSEVENWTSVFIHWTWGISKHDVYSDDARV
jgi:hypothetical protein